MHYATHGQTAAEIIFYRVDSKKNNLGLTNFKGNYPTKSETEIAKNYLTEEDQNQIYEEVKDAAYDIIKRKGSTCYGIGMCLVRITNAILGNENSIITVSSYDSENGIFIGCPTIINKYGVRERIKITLTEEEEKRMNHSIHTVKEAIQHISQ